MRRILSAYMMIMAVLAMLLGTALPHHHHCLSSYSPHIHNDYICFATNEGHCDDSHSNDCHHEEGDCNHQHHAGSSNAECPLCSVTTIVTQRQAVPDAHYFLEYVMPVRTDCDLISTTSQSDCFVPVRQELKAGNHITTRGLRAPPVA